MSQPSSQCQEVLARQGRAEAITVRHARLDDVEALLELEAGKWTDEQAAGAQDMAERIGTYPMLALGAFRRDTGEALASLFMRPIADRQMRTAATWRQSSQAWVPEGSTRSLFGVSLTSNSSAAVSSLFTFFWPHALKAGWRRIYLGSPVPGLRAWRHANPNESAEVYVRQMREGVPLDPQLRYYYHRGFRRIDACKPAYFPHKASLDHAAIISGQIPLSAAAPLWRVTPLPWLQAISAMLEAML